MQCPTDGCDGELMYVRTIVERWCVEEIDGRTVFAEGPRQLHPGDVPDVVACSDCEYETYDFEAVSISHGDD